MRILLIYKTRFVRDSISFWLRNKFNIFCWEEHFFGCIYLTNYFHIFRQKKIFKRDMFCAKIFQSLCIYFYKLVFFGHDYMQNQFNLFRKIVNETELFVYSLVLIQLFQILKRIWEKKILKRMWFCFFVIFTVSN